MNERDLQQRLLRAVLATLEPLVARMLALGIRYGEFESRLRGTFVGVADRASRTHDGPQTDSRLAMLTGLNRREIRRIRAKAPELAAPSSFTRDFAAELFTRWRTTPGLADASGNPLPLPLRAKSGPSFAKLVREMTVDFRPQLLLEHLVRGGAVELRDGHVVPKSGGAYVPARGAPEKLEILANDPAELIETILHNVFEPGELRLQRKVSFDALGSDAIAGIRKELRRRGERFTASVNRYLARYDRDLNRDAPGGDPTTAGLGVYYFEGRTRTAKPRGKRRHRKESE